MSAIFSLRALEEAAHGAEEHGMLDDGGGSELGVDPNRYDLEGAEEHHETHDVFAVLLPWFVQALGIIVFYLLTRYLHLLPYTAVMFVLGLLMGVGATLTQNGDQLTQSIRLWTAIDYEVLFTVFLPGLLFKDALEINFHLFWASISQLLTLAFPLVLAGTVLTALVAQHVLPYGWSFYQSLTLGSILAATDPVAVASLLNEVGAPPRLKVHISGESLLNDGSAVVFFFVFGGLFLHELGIDGLGEDSTVGEAFAIFFRMSLGGVAVGFAFAMALVFILYRLDRRMEKEEIVLQVAATVTIAYLSFYTSEVVCKMSGVIAVVTCGITTKAFGGGMISDWQVMDSFWSLLEHLLNSLIFALGGIVFGEIIVRKGLWDGRDWGFLVVLYLFVNIIRFFQMFSFYPINSRIGLGTNWREAVFMSWAGLRGAVGITLALALDNAVFAATTDEDFDKRVLTTKMFGMVGGVALFTLIINGTSSGPVLQKLNLGDSTASRKRIVGCAEDALQRRVLDDFIHLMTDDRFFFVDFALVRHHVPYLKDLKAKDLEVAVQANKDAVHPKQYKTPHLQMVLPYMENTAGVRATLVKAQRDFFSSGAPLEEDTGLLGTVHEEESDEEMEKSRDNEPTKTSDVDESVLKETRLMFIELLRAAYQAQIQDGELDPREFNGFLAYALFQSLDLAEDAISSDKPLTDWESSQIGYTKTIYKFENYFERLFGCCCNKKTTAKERMAKFHDTEPFEYQKQRLDVLRALSFIDAHTEAQERLRDEFGGATGDAAKAFVIVMKESQAEVRSAGSVLTAQNKKKLKIIISHYLCVILLNKAARYIKSLADSGVLLPRESRHMLEEIDHNIIEVRKCKFDKHPDALEFSEDLSFVKRGRERRKRTRQNSLL